MAEPRSRRTEIVEAFEQRQDLDIPWPEFADLDSFIAALRDAGVSWDSIARLVDRLTGITISGERMRVWQAEDPGEAT